MASASTYQFSITNQKHTFELVIPPSAHGHSLRITIDGAKNRGSVVVLPNTSSDSDHDEDAHCGCAHDCDCDREPSYPQEPSHRHREPSLDESMSNLRPFGHRQPASAPACHTGYSVSLASGKRAVKTSDHYPEHSGKRPVMGQDFTSSPQHRHYPRAQHAGPSAGVHDIPDDLPTWAELAERAKDGKSQGCHPPNNEDNNNATIPGNNPNDPSNLHIPFHRLPAVAHVDGDSHPEVFALPDPFRRKYPPTLRTNRDGKAWWAVLKGYEIGVFCDSWPRIHALTNPVNGFQKKAETWRQAVAYYQEYERASKTHRYIL